MKTELECTSCFLRNTLNLAQRLTEDRRIREKIVREMLAKLSTFDFRQPSPIMSRDVFGIATALSGVEDPYREEKDLSNRLALEFAEELEKKHGTEYGDFLSRVRLAISGNIIDFGVNCEFNMAEASDKIAEAFRQPLDEAAVRRAEKAMEEATDILYLLDNCGEAVFDRFLLEPYKEKVTLCVRGYPILNDVTRRDLPFCGLDRITDRVVDTGDWTPGISMEHSSPEFREAFRKASLVVAKGLGNFETLEGQTDRPVVYLFMAKCPLICRKMNVPFNSLQVRTENLG